MCASFLKMPNTTTYTYTIDTGMNYSKTYALGRLLDQMGLSSMYIGTDVMKQIQQNSKYSPCKKDQKVYAAIN